MVREDEWMDLAPMAKGSKAAIRHPVEFSLAKARGGRARGTLTFSAEVLKPLGMKTWRCRVRLGHGGNAGRVAIVPAVDGPFEIAAVKSPKTRTETGRYRLVLPPIDSFPDIVLAPDGRPFEVGLVGATKVLTVTLPQMCFRADLRQREEERYARAKASEGAA